MSYGPVSQITQHNTLISSNEVITNYLYGLKVKISCLDLTILKTARYSRSRGCDGHLLIIDILVLARFSVVVFSRMHAVSFTSHFLCFVPSFPHFTSVLQ